MSDNPAVEPVKEGEAPDWARKEIKDANDEAARRRIENRELTTQVETLTGQVQALTEQKVSAEDRANKAESSLLRLNVALAAGVPGEHAAKFAARLVGTTEAELKADAEEAMALFNNGHPVSRPTDPSQGRGNDTPAPTTPQAEFAQLLSELPIFRK